MPDGLYHRDGTRFLPDVLTTGPWDPGAQHGGPPAALLTGAVEAVEAPAPMQVARITFELLRPVPLRPLTVRTEVVRPGRKVQLVQASLLAHDDDGAGDGVEVVRALALRIRAADLPIPDGTIVPDEPLPEPAAAAVQPAGGGGFVEGPAFHTEGVELRWAHGAFDTPGPAAAWVRLRVPVVAGEPTTPTMRAVAAADFGNGFSGVLPRPAWVYINPDLTVHLARPPLGEWVCLRATTFPSGTGMAFAEGELHDEVGRIGRSVQSLLLDRFDPPPAGKGSQP